MGDDSDDLDIDPGQAKVGKRKDRAELCLVAAGK
jgi:hypothetical protein